MYLKKICIVSNVIGNRDVIQNEENGFIAKNIEEYKKIIYKIKNKKNIIKKRETAFKDIKIIYNTNTMITKYKTIYK